MAQGRFQVHAVDDVDVAIELLRNVHAAAPVGSANDERPAPPKVRTVRCHTSQRGGRYAAGARMAVKISSDSA